MSQLPEKALTFLRTVATKELDARDEREFRRIAATLEAASRGARGSKPRGAASVLGITTLLERLEDLAGPAGDAQKIGRLSSQRKLLLVCEPNWVDDG